MWTKVIVAGVLILASFSDCATQFNLNFVHSSNKVVVTDFYFMLEYSVHKGSESSCVESSEEQRRTGVSDGKFLIKFQMIEKSNQLRWALDLEDSWSRETHREGSFYLGEVMKLNLQLRLMSEIIRNLASAAKTSGKGFTMFIRYYSTQRMS